VARHTGHDTNAKVWRLLLPFAEIVRSAPTLQKQPWGDFANRRGDCEAQKVVFRQWIPLKKSAAGIPANPSRRGFE